MSLSDQYGSPEYYAEMFSDILADVDAGCKNKDLDQPTAENIYTGFLLAIDSWLEYHQAQAEAYTMLKHKVKSALE